MNTFHDNTDRSDRPNDAGSEPTPSSPQAAGPSDDATLATHRPGSEGPEQWVREAIEQQEEYLKRIRSCMDTLGRSHAFRPFGAPSPDGVAAKALRYSACVVCGVTETDADYQVRRSLRGSQADESPRGDNPSER